MQANAGLASFKEQPSGSWGVCDSSEPHVAPYDVKLKSLVKLSQAWGLRMDVEIARHLETCDVLERAAHPPPAEEDTAGGHDPVAEQAGDEPGGLPEAVGVPEGGLTLVHNEEQVAAFEEAVRSATTAREATVAAIDCEWSTLHPLALVQVCLVSQAQHHVWLLDMLVGGEVQTRLAGAMKALLEEEGVLKLGFRRAHTRGT